MHIKALTSVMMTDRFFFSFSQIQDAGELHQDESGRGGHGAAAVPRLAGQRLVVERESHSHFHTH